MYNLTTLPYRLIKCNTRKLHKSDPSNFSDNSQIILSSSMASSSFTQITSISSHYKNPHFKTPLYFSPPSFISKTTLYLALSENVAGSIATSTSPEEEGLVTGSVNKFENTKWVNGTWDLTQFQSDGKKTDWDAVIDAEVRRRKWLEDTPESSSNDSPVSFDTSIIPWWAWIKRFHLPEAELLNGRAAMIGFFMAYLVDSLTGVGIVYQMGNFVCKTLLFVAVVGVVVIRKNEDVEKVKKLIDETTFYDKQWQATWQDETTGKCKRE